MRRTLLFGALLALVFTAPAAAQTTLMPGVTYERGVQFTPHGPVAIHSLTGRARRALCARSRPLERDIRARALTAMQKRLSATATTVGVNGDFFDRRRASERRPDAQRRRSTARRTATARAPGSRRTARCDVRVSSSRHVAGLGQRRALNDLNQPPGANGTSLFTPATARPRPRSPASWRSSSCRSRRPRPNTDLTGPVSRHRQDGGTPIPPGGAVLVARGTAAARLAEEAPFGTTVTLRVLTARTGPGSSTRSAAAPCSCGTVVPLPRERGLHVRSARAAEPAHWRRPARGRRIRARRVDGRRPATASG